MLHCIFLLCTKAPGEAKTPQNSNNQIIKGSNEKTNSQPLIQTTSSSWIHQEMKNTTHKPSLWCLPCFSYNNHSRECESKREGDPLPQLLSCVAGRQDDILGLARQRLSEQVRCQLLLAHVLCWEKRTVTSRDTHTDQNGNKRPRM